MGNTTAIEWTDATWNPVRGCDEVSPGCKNCYAKRVAARFSGPGQAYEGLATMKTFPPSDFWPEGHTEPMWTGKVSLVPEHLDDPLRWRRPRKIFVNSMSDLFHDGLSNEDIAAVFGIMAASPRHTFQVLTKRAQRMKDWFEWVAREEGARRLGLIIQHAQRLSDHPTLRTAMDFLLALSWPLPNVWLGVSVENQKRADERIPWLLETPAAVRFVSAEPLLGPVDISEYLDPCAAPCGDTEATLDWVIAGAESGPGARAMDEAWVASLRDQCGLGVPFFYKQRLEAGRKVTLPLLDGVQHAAFPA